MRPLTIVRSEDTGEDTLLPAIARSLGASLRATEVALWGPLNLANRCARVIAALNAAGAHDALVQFIQPIDLAIHTARRTAMKRPRRFPKGSTAPTREHAQACLDRLYEEIGARAAAPGRSPSLGL